MVTLQKPASSAYRTAPTPPARRPMPITRTRAPSRSFPLIAGPGREAPGSRGGGRASWAPVSDQRPARPAAKARDEGAFTRSSLLLLVLSVRPSGLFGKTAIKKV